MLKLPIPKFDSNKRFTPEELFNQSMTLVREHFFTDEKKQSVFDNKLEIDYILAQAYNFYNDKKITNHGFDVVCIPHYGSSEGIYISVNLSGKIFAEENLNSINHGTYYSIGTLKTLSSDFDAMRYCGELAGIITAIMTDFVSVNLDCFDIKKK